MSTLGNIWTNLDWSVLTNILFGIIPALICIVLHELSHGLVAYWLGDDTAKNAGRLTLNPIRHIDWMGLVAMALFHFGWAKPVPVNMYRFKNPKRGMAITALAGPVSNFIIAAVFLFLYGFLFYPLRTGGFSRAILNMIATTATMSLSLGVFNLIPIPPLDGSKVLFSVLRDEAYAKLMRYERYGMIVMIALIATGALSGGLGSAINWMLDKMWFIVEFAGNLVRN